MLPAASIISGKNTQFKANPMNPQMRPPFISKLDLQTEEDNNNEQKQQ